MTSNTSSSSGSLNPEHLHVTIWFKASVLFLKHTTNKEGEVLWSPPHLHSKPFQGDTTLCSPGALLQKQAPAALSRSYCNPHHLPAAMTEHGPGEHAGLRSCYSHDEVSSQPDQGEEGVLQGRSQGQTLATERPQVGSLHSTDVALGRDGVIGESVALQGGKADMNGESTRLQMLTRAKRKSKTPLGFID